MNITRQTGALGAQIEGVNLNALDDASFESIERAFLDHVVLVFRDQDLEPGAHVAFTERFGAVEPHPLRARRHLDDHPGVMLLENKAGNPGPRNDFWHSDITHAECPPQATVLHALEVPEGRGDTQFCNMYRAYEQLSPGMQKLLGKLSAWHSGEATARRNNLEQSNALRINDVPPPMEHPVVRTHPKTGRKALYVNPFFTTHFSGMTEEESHDLLQYLYDRATVPENIYRHRWAKGDVVMWDNRCAMHYAVKDYDDSMVRIMHRTTAAGDRPQ